jgi:hypothetical protein
MAKVCKSDGEGTVSRTRGSDKVAPESGSCQTDDLIAGFDPKQKQGGAH